MLCLQLGNTSIIQRAEDATEHSENECPLERAAVGVGCGFH